MKTKLTFNDVKDIQLDASDRKALASLSDRRDWLRFKAIVEDYILKLNYNLVSGTEIDKDVSFEELRKIRGFVYYWNKLVNLVEDGEHHKTDEEINKDTN